MKISYNTLKKYIPELESPEKVAEKLILHSAEVEGIEKQGTYIKDVYIGKILEIKKHPNADKLNLCQVEVLGREQQIVCGAPNVRAGLIVPVAIVGAKLAPDFVIKKAKLRGEVSEGMICSEDELGLVTERQQGIMELPDDAPINMSMQEYLEKNDTILEIDNKAINHRPDMFSHIGVARDLAVIYGKKLDIDYEKKDFSHLPKKNILNTIPEVVSRYSVLEASGVQNIPSPSYIQTLIASADVKSKGLLIDVSNYSLYFYGQPTHLFDADTLSGDIQIRYAKQDESFLALNEKTYTLTSDDIVIADDKNILALAGIIGAKNHSVSDNTKHIIIESANFPQDILRKTGRRLGIRTDSLNVFEKGVPPELTLPALALIAKILGENFPQMQLLSFGDEYTHIQEKISIPDDKAYTEKLIGKSYSDDFYTNTLKNLGIQKKEGKLLIPFWRTDIRYKADIAEEIARIDGYDTIPLSLDLGMQKAVKQPYTYTLKRNIKNLLSSQGFMELYSYSFVGESIFKKVDYSSKLLVGLKNTLSEEATHMRPDGVVPLLKAAEENRKLIESPKFFEIEKIFLKKNTNIIEKEVLAAIAIYKSDTPYFEIQKTLRNIFHFLHIDAPIFEKNDNPEVFSHKNRSANIILAGKKIGIIGEVDPRVSQNFGISKKIAYFQLDIEAITEPKIKKYKEISPYQENNFDINFVLDKTTPALTLKNTLSSVSPYIKNLKLLDVFEDQEKLGDKKSITYKIYYQAQDRTLDDTDKAELIEKMQKAAKKINASLR